MVESFSAEIISAGRVTIPKHIRESMHLKDGEKLDFTVKRPVRETKNIII